MKIGLSIEDNGGYDFLVVKLIGEEGEIIGIDFISITSLKRAIENDLSGQP